MKLNVLTTIALSAYSIFALSSCGGKGHDHDQEHAGHDHDGEEEHADHDHDDHDHGEAKKAGPNGGRLLTNVEPHAEYFVKPDRTVQIAFVNEGNKVLAAEQQAVKIFAGDRSAITTLNFTAKDGVLASDKPLPAGDDFPVVVQLTMTPGAAAVTEKFTMDFSDCPTCDYLEYACTCDH